MKQPTISSEKFDRIAKLNEYYTYLVIIIGLAILQLPLPFDINKNPVYVVALVVFILQVLWHRVVLKRFSGESKNFIESLVDLAGIFLVVYFTGGIRSFFFFLYFLPILSNSVYMPFKKVLIISGLTSLLIGIQIATSFGTNDLLFAFSLGALQIWAVWLITSYGRFLSSEINIVKKREEEIKVEEAREVEILKDEFIFIISHELRSPITAIRGYLELLITDSVGKITGKVKSVLENAFIMSNQLTNLVSLMLEIARLETGKIRFYIQDVSVKDFLKKAVSDLKSEAKEKNIDISEDFDVNLSVQVDYERLEEIMNILINNAIAYTPKFGKVVIEARKKDNMVEIKVIDNGVGISSEKKEHLFEKFYTEKTSLGEKAIKATNVGMYVARELLLKMKGNIRVESELGKGSTFTVVLPSSKNKT